MNHNRFLCILIASLFTYASGFGQQLIQKSEIKEPIISLLLNYQSKLAGVKPNLNTDPSRELIRLFANPHVQVVNNLYKDSANSTISIRDYCTTLNALYEDGISASFNATKIRLGQLTVEFGDQFKIPVRLFLGISAFPNGTIYEMKQMVEISITFLWDGEAPSNFRIAGISTPEYKQQEIGIKVLSGGSAISAPWIQDEDQISQALSYSGGFGVQYSYWFKSGFGVATGLNMQLYQSHVRLEKLDAFMGKDPHISNVQLNTQLHQINWPLKVLLQRKLSNRISAFIHPGIVLSYRYWEDFESSAIQSQLNKEITGVISEPFGDSELSKISMEIDIETGISVKISRRMMIYGGLNLMTGISPIDRQSDLDFETNKFAGQYNPLWMDPNSRNQVQFVGFSLGVSYILKKRDNN